MTTELSEQDLYILSFYRASELAGGLLLGKIAFHTDIDELRSSLTRHAAEEMEHGWLWTKAIKDLGKIPIKVTQTYQSEYGREFGMPTKIIEVLALTQVLELRVMKHFTYHLAQKPLNAVIEATLKQMIEDEQGHLNWIKIKLDQYAAAGHHEEVDLLMRRLLKVDEIAYKRLCAEPRFASFFNETL